MVLSESKICELEREFEEFESIDDGDCDDCGVVPANGRLWWESGCPEYPHDGTARCDDCAYKHLHQYDDFDDSEYREEM